MKCGNYLVDVGCGYKKQAGFIGIDISSSSNADIIHDIRNGMPFCNESVKYIRAHSVLEHLDTDEFIQIMKEFWRVLTKDGVLEVLVPYGGDEIAFKDPTHKKFFSMSTFSYFRKKNEKDRLYNLPTFDDFEIKIIGSRSTREIFFRLRKQI